MTLAARIAPLTRQLSGRPQAAVLTVLTAVTTLVALELLRGSGVLTAAFAGRHGAPTAAAVALLGYGCAALAGPLVWWLGSRSATTVAVSALAVVRLLAQLPALRGAFTAAVAVAVALGALLLLVRVCVAAVPDGPAHAARAVALGVAADLALRLPLDLWDPVWRGGPLGWTVSLLLSATLITLGRALREARRGEPPPSTMAPFQLVAVGPTLALSGAVLASPAALAARAGVSVTAAGLWVAAGLVVGIAALSGASALPARVRQVRPAWTLPSSARQTALPLTLLCAVALLPLLDGALALPVTVTGLAVLPHVLGQALTPGAWAVSTSPLLALWYQRATGSPFTRRLARLRPGGAQAAQPTGQLSSGLPAVEAEQAAGPGTRARAILAGWYGPAVALALAGLGCAVAYLFTAAPYLTLPGALPALAGVLLLGGLAAGRVQESARPFAGRDSLPVLVPAARPFWPVLAAALLLAIPPLVGAARAAPAPPAMAAQPDGSYRLLTWNVHAAVDARGALVPDEVLAVLERSGADVVVLQEVPRGAPGSGGLDLVAWLEGHLDVATVWAPAADGRTGNLILTTLPVSQPRTGSLSGGGAVPSYGAVTVTLPDGGTSRVVTTHLSGDATEKVRTRQLAPLLANDEHPGRVLAGDLNATVGSPELDAVRAAGFHSAQDEAGDHGQDTAPGLDPSRRVDWILGAAGVRFEGTETLDSAASDHLPLVTSVLPQ